MSQTHATLLCCVAVAVAPPPPINEQAPLLQTTHNSINNTNTNEMVLPLHQSWFLVTSHAFLLRVWKTQLTAKSTNIEHCCPAGVTAPINVIACRFGRTDPTYAADLIPLPRNDDEPNRVTPLLPAPLRFHDIFLPTLVDRS